MRTGGLRPSGRTRALPVPRDKERLHMPGSPTTSGHMGACDVAPIRVAFHTCDSVGPRNDSFAAQWLACALPYRRFARTLAGACARLGADAVRYSFTVVDFHHLLLAGLTGAPQIFRYVPASKFARPPDRPYRCEYCRRAAGAFTSGHIVLCCLRTHRIC